MEAAAATAADLAGDTDAAYGLPVFLRHYCVHLAGPDPTAVLPAFPAARKTLLAVAGLGSARPEADHRKWPAS